METNAIKCNLPRKQVWELLNKASIASIATISHVQKKFQWDVSWDTTSVSATKPRIVTENHKSWHTKPTTSQSQPVVERCQCPLAIMSCRLMWEKALQYGAKTITFGEEMLKIWPKHVNLMRLNAYSHTAKRGNSVPGLYLHSQCLPIVIHDCPEVQWIFIRLVVV